MSSRTALAGLDYWKVVRREELERLLHGLLSARKIAFDERLRSALPEDPGIYAISVHTASPGEFLRAGRTKTAAGGLRQRIYQNHLMGNQSGNLPAQLWKAGVCDSIPEAKSWIQQNCVVQFLAIHDERSRTWAEHFMLAVLQPTYCD